MTRVDANAPVVVMTAGAFVFFERHRESDPYRCMSWLRYAWLA